MISLDSRVQTRSLVPRRAAIVYLLEYFQVQHADQDLLGFDGYYHVIVT